MQRDRAVRALDLQFGGHLKFTEPFCWVILEAAGSWNFFCAQIMWAYNNAAIELAAAVFINDYNSMAMSFVTKPNFWRRKCYRIRLDSVFSLSWFHHRDDSITSEGVIHLGLRPRWITPSDTLLDDKHDRMLVQLVLNGLRDVPVPGDHVNSMFLNYLCSSIFFGK